MVCLLSLEYVTPLFSASDSHPKVKQEKSHINIYVIEWRSLLHYELLDTRK